MSKFNRTTTRSAVTSPITTERVASGVTHEGAPGYVRDAKGELFLLAIANMVGEAAFYEKAGDRDERYERLVAQVAVEDPEWTLGFLRWLRLGGNMRSASLVGAAEAVKAQLAAGIVGGRQVIDAVLQRADEPGEILAYWTSKYGRAIPKPVKRGVADAVARLYNERSLLKYDTASHGFRFGDVLNLVHASPAVGKTYQGGLFGHALDRRHGRDNDIPERLGILRRNALLRTEAAEGNFAGLLDATVLDGAGMTWEDALSLGGSKVDKKALWSAMIPSMGIMALARNLRNFDEAGVPDDVAALVAAKFTDPQQVARSRMFPFRWLAAYRNAPSLRWGHTLDRALTASLTNVPTLAGRTLILVDVSGSMSDRAGGKMSEMTRADVAGVFGAAVAMRTDAPTLAWFNDRSGRVDVPTGGSLLKLVEAIPRPGGGTYTAAAVQRWYTGHDRVIVITDEQAADGGGAQFVPAHVPVYVWNLAGYRLGQAPSGSAGRYSFGGLSDQAFALIPLLESRRDGGWPWETAA